MSGIWPTISSWWCHCGLPTCPTCSQYQTNSITNSPWTSWTNGVVYASGIISFAQKQVVYDKIKAYQVIKKDKEIIIQEVDLCNIHAFQQYLSFELKEVEDAELYIKSLKLENL